MKIKKQDHVVNEQSEKVLQQSAQIGTLNTDLSEVRSQAEQLSVKAIDAQRGVSETYDFNGVKVQNFGSGRESVISGEDTVVVQKILLDNNTKNWELLKEPCEYQINNMPDLLTSYLYSGIAFANLGEFQAAKQHASSDPQYSDANRLLTQLQAHTMP